MKSLALIFGLLFASAIAFASTSISSSTVNEYGVEQVIDMQDEVATPCPADCKKECCVKADKKCPAGCEKKCCKKESCDKKTDAEKAACAKEKDKKACCAKHGKKETKE